MTKISKKEVEDLHMLEENSHAENTPIRKLSDLDKMSLELAKANKKIALANAETALAKNETAEYAYKYTVLQLYFLNGLSVSDTINEDGQILSAKKE